MNQELVVSVGGFFALSGGVLFILAQLIFWLGGKKSYQRAYGEDTGPWTQTGTGGMLVAQGCFFTGAALLLFIGFMIVFAGALFG